MDWSFHNSEKACVERFSNAVKHITTAVKGMGTLLQAAGLNMSHLADIQCQLSDLENYRLRKCDVNWIQGIILIVKGSDREGENSWRVKYVKLLENLKDTQ